MYNKQYPLENSAKAVKSKYQTGGELHFDSFRECRFNRTERRHLSVQGRLVEHMLLAAPWMTELGIALLQSWSQAVVENPRVRSAQVIPKPITHKSVVDARCKDLFQPKANAKRDKKQHHVSSEAMIIHDNNNVSIGCQFESVLDSKRVTTQETLSP